MSIAAMTWAFRQELRPASLKFLLVSLADNADDEGRAFPSVETLSRKTGLNRKTVIAGLDELERRGLAADTGKRVGRTAQVKVYRLTKFKDSENGTVERNSTEKGIPFSDGKGPVFTRKGSQKRYSEPSGEPSEEPIEGKRAARAATAKRIPDDFELTQDRRAIAETEKVDAAREFARFTDHFRASSGSNARKHDWDAAWRNWCRKASELIPRTTRGGVGVSPRQLESEALQKLMDRRVAIGLPGFRDPHAGETVVDYRKAQDDEHTRLQIERERSRTRTAVAGLVTAKAMQ